MQNQNKNNNETRYLTIPQAADALGIPTSTLRRAESAGLIKSYQSFSKRKRVVLSEVRDAIAAFGGQGDD
jgi:predicted site-specific integrase-resolvase